MERWELGQNWGWVWEESVEETIFPLLKVWAGEALMFWEEDLCVEEVQVGLGLGSPEGPLCGRVVLTPLLMVKVATDSTM